MLNKYEKLLSIENSQPEVQLPELETLKESIESDFNLLESLESLTRLARNNQQAGVLSQEALSYQELHRKRLFRKVKTALEGYEEGKSIEMFAYELIVKLIRLIKEYALKFYDYVRAQFNKINRLRNSFVELKNEKRVRAAENFNAQIPFVTMSSLTYLKADLTPWSSTALKTTGLPDAYKNLVALTEHACRDAPEQMLKIDDELIRLVSKLTPLDLEDTSNLLKMGDGLDSKLMQQVRQIQNNFDNYIKVTTGDEVLPGGYKLELVIPENAGGDLYVPSVALQPAVSLRNSNENTREVVPLDLPEILKVITSAIAVCDNILSYQSIASKANNQMQRLTKELDSLAKRYPKSNENRVGFFVNKLRRLVFSTTEFPKKTIAYATPCLTQGLEFCEKSVAALKTR